MVSLDESVSFCLTLVSLDGGLHPPECFLGDICFSLLDDICLNVWFVCVHRCFTKMTTSCWHYRWATVLTAASQLTSSDLCRRLRFSLLADTVRLINSHIIILLGSVHVTIPLTDHPRPPTSGWSWWTDHPPVFEIL